MAKADLFVLCVEGGQFRAASLALINDRVA